MANGELQERANLEIMKHNGMRAAGRYWDVSHSIIGKAANGGNSPTLRRLWDIPKNEPVPRLIINGFSPEQKARFERMRGEIPRAEFQEHLMDWYEFEGELPY